MNKIEDMDLPDVSKFLWNNRNLYDEWSNKIYKKMLEKENILM